MDANSIPRTYPSLVQQNFTWVDWMLTSKPKYFGLVPGTAYPTGVGLLVILLIMFICSMKWVRKGGYFEVKTNFYDCSINYRYLIEYTGFITYTLAITKLYGFLYLDILLDSFTLRPVLGPSYHSRSSILEMVHSASHLVCD